ncbi:hypothetical protein BDW22DRAFT_1352969 [Trametopsis cervina]|nr:hypothetical protein BDW22DRAFT_1352969 [Trametopsis cervina]
MDVSMDSSTLASCSFKHAVSGPAIAGGLDEGRKATINDVGPAVCQVPLQWFKDKILPPLPSKFNLQDAIQSLKQNGTILNERWAAFAESPSAQSAHEDKVFAPFATIAKNVGEAAKKQLSREPAVVFECNPDIAPYSHLRRNTSKPDGYGVYRRHRSFQSDSPICWEFIVAPGEKKQQRRVVDLNDNITKLLWSFGHLMREDPGRRFVVGYTIEDTDMRLWFGSRSEILVSEEFDFIEDYESLVHFFVSQMYATPQQLGFDPTMQPAADLEARRKNRYDITVHYTDPENLDGPKKSISYRTVEGGLLSSIGAEAIKSRGTRVWHAQEIVKGGVKPEKVVIKDYWVDSDRTREAVTRAEILRAAKDDEQRKLLRTYLLTPLYWGDVMLDDDLPDSTFGVIRRAAVLPSNAQVFPTVHSKPSKFADRLIEDLHLAPQGTGAILHEAAHTLQVPISHNKHRHRIVFAEMGPTIESLTSVCDIFQAGAQAALALRALHSTGWLHRDISSGNILIVDGIVKLTDLEYAKNMMNSTSHSERYGTLYFMALEVRYHRYRFLPDEGPIVSEAAQGDNSTFKIGSRRAPKPRAPMPDAIDRKISKAAPFKHNPLHDIESLWWLLVFLTMTRKVVVEGSDSKTFGDQYAYYSPIFTEQLKRVDALTLPQTFIAGQQHIHPAMDTAIRALEHARLVIVNAYRNAEKNVDGIDHTAGDSVCGSLYNIFLRAANTYDGRDVELKKIRPSVKDTPELPAATVLAHATTVDLGTVAMKRPRDHDLDRVEVDDALFRQEHEIRKRTKKASSEADVAVDEVSGAASGPSGTQ